MIQIQTVIDGLPGLPGVITQFFDGDGQTSADNAVGRVNDFWEDLQDILNENLTVRVGTVATDLNATTGEATAFWAVDGQAWDGTAPGQPLPFATQANLAYLTNTVVAGRRVQGRSYIAGLLEAQSTDGVVDPVVQGLIATAATNFLGAAGPNPHVVWSRPVEGGRAGIAAPVTGYACRSQWAVLRSRRD